jgi:DNA polymerase
LVRGALPADIFFCGEAPGESEDVLGKPFCGPAGHLLDEIVAEAVPGHLKTAFGNLVGCLPMDDGGNKTGAPDEEAIRTCAPRLQEIVKLANPKIVVCVGKLATTWLREFGTHRIQLRVTHPPHYPTLISIDHPAHILRANVASQRTMKQRAVVVIQRAVELIDCPF